MTRVLLTGAGGVLGSELLGQLRAVPGVDVVGVTSQGLPGAGVAAWRMGHEQRPAALAGPWDVVAHCAASTRWSMSPEEAVEANLRPTQALAEVVGPQTHLVHVSTAYAGGRTGSVTSPHRADYRNSYEWSKAACERYVAATWPGSTIYRPPLVVGRRADGYVTRFSGIYMFMRAATTGLAPALVASPRGRLEIVPVDDVARRAVDLVTGPRPATTRVDVIGRGEHALTVTETLDVVQAAVDGVRAEHGLAPVERPPLLDPQRWQRFYLPMARSALSPRQLRIVELLGEFEPYTCLEEPLQVTTTVEDVRPALHAAMRYWADQHPGAALGSPRAWSARAA